MKRKTKKKRYIQACDIGGSIYGKRNTGKVPAATKTNKTKKEIRNVYNKFYKNQLEALYKAIHGE